MSEHMADIVEAVLLEEHLNGKLPGEVMNWHLPSLHHIVRVLEEQEGYVKVVRCKECKWWKAPELEQITGGCCLQNFNSYPDDYCSAGERVVAESATGEEVPNA